MNILVTGANGFVGQALCLQLNANSHLFPEGKFYGLVRPHAGPKQAELPELIYPVVKTSLSSLADDASLLSQIDCIVHLAARVHQMRDQAADPLAAFRAVNTQATYTLAQAAAKAGVRRFIYLSSVKVYGEGSNEPVPFRETDVPNPQDPYGQSKWEAEILLNQVAAETGLEIVILRPPLIYGPQVKANFLQLLRLVKSGIPLPFKTIKNVRSFLFVENLVDAILNCAQNPKASGQTFLISDGIALSTPELIYYMARALKCRPRLFGLPPNTLKTLGYITGRTSTVDRLLSSFMVDSQKIVSTLNWSPPYSIHQGLTATADWYLRLYR